MRQFDENGNFVDSVIPEGIKEDNNLSTTSNQVSKVTYSYVSKINNEEESFFIEVFVLLFHIKKLHKQQKHLKKRFHLIKVILLYNPPF